VAGCDKHWTTQTYIEKVCRQAVAPAGMERDLCRPDESVGIPKNPNGGNPPDSAATIAPVESPLQHICRLTMLNKTKALLRLNIALKQPHNPSRPSP
jgi:hypothetical protein